MKIVLSLPMRSFPLIRALILLGASTIIFSTGFWSGYLKGKSHGHPRIAAAIFVAELDKRIPDWSAHTMAWEVRAVAWQDLSQSLDGLKAFEPYAEKMQEFRVSNPLVWNTLSQLPGAKLLDDCLQESESLIKFGAETRRLHIDLVAALTDYRQAWRTMHDSPSATSVRSFLQQVSVMKGLGDRSESQIANIQQKVDTTERQLSSVRAFLQGLSMPKLKAWALKLDESLQAPANSVATLQAHFRSKLKADPAAMASIEHMQSLLGNRQLVD